MDFCFWDRVLYVASGELKCRGDGCVKIEIMIGWYRHRPWTKALMGGAKGLCIYTHNPNILPLVDLP
jgi:hypothetical protein